MELIEDGEILLHLFHVQRVIEFSEDFYGLLAIVEIEDLVDG